jgi:hypothetical protein
MQCEDVILKKMLDENKPDKIRMNIGLKVRRPDPHSILAEEVYSDNQNPFEERQVMTALIKLWLKDKRVKLVTTTTKNTKIDWWVLK